MSNSKTVLTKEPNIKTIDINALEWFDKVNGNSYFAATVTVNYGMPDALSFVLPFQYGYGSQYEQEAKSELYKRGYLPGIEVYPSGGLGSISEYCHTNNIIMRSDIQKSCKKRELITLSA